MNNKVNHQNENAIDLKILIRSFIKNIRAVFFIMTLTLCITIVYLFVKTPIYEANAVIEIGSYKNGLDGYRLIDDPKKLSRELNVLFIDIFEHIEERESWVKSIEVFEGEASFINIKSAANTKKKAIEEIEKILNYLRDKHFKYIQAIKNRKNLELIQIENEIHIMKDNTLVNLREDIKYIKNVLIPSLEEKIKISQDRLNALKEELLITNKNILATQEEDASLTALIFMEKRSLENQIGGLELKLITLNNDLLRQNENILPNKQREEKKLMDIHLKELLEKKVLVEESLLKHNFKNSYIVGQIIADDRPTEPNKKILLIFAIIFGFIFSIVFISFRNFIVDFNNDLINSKE